MGQVPKGMPAGPGTHAFEPLRLANPRQLTALHDYFAEPPASEQLRERRRLETSQSDEQVGSRAASSLPHNCTPNALKGHTVETPRYLGWEVRHHFPDRISRLKPGATDSRRMAASLPIQTVPSSRSPASTAPVALPPQWYSRGSPNAVPAR